jgi:hypothetical protein
VGNTGFIIDIDLKKDGKKKLSRERDVFDKKNRQRCTKEGRGLGGMHATGGGKGLGSTKG